MSVEITQLTQKGNNIKLFWKNGNESGCFQFDQTKMSKNEAMRFVEKNGGESDDETEPASASTPKSSRPKIKK